ncbi:MAG: type IX secretion system membrane protein PorP/SprF [Bacteroidota bacterium]
MRKTILLALCLCGLWGTSKAQQDPMFTKYMFNSLVFNPAYAGSHEYLSARIIYRDQWLGIDGAPTTQSLTVHTPTGERVGVGLSIYNDQIGASGSTTVNFAYAYRVAFGRGKLSIGIQAGVENWRADWSGLKFKDPQQMDAVFSDGINRWIPNFGAGVFYYAPKFYVGFSVPHLINFDLQDDADALGLDEWAKLYRHYFLSAGVILPIAPGLLFKPSILFKSVGFLGEFSSSPNSFTIGAPTEFDIDLSVLFYEALWVGVSFRSAVEARAFGGLSSFDSADIWAAYYLRSGLRIGAAYDYTLSDLRTFTDGSFEILLGYDFNFSNKKINTPRYF